MLWVDLDFDSYFEMLDSNAEEKLQKLREPPNIILLAYVLQYIGYFFIINIYILYKI